MKNRIHRCFAVALLAVLLPCSYGNAAEKGKVTESAATKKPIRVFLLSGQSNMVGHGPMKGVKQLRPDLLPARDDVWTIGASMPGHPLQGEGESNNLGIDLTFGATLADKLEEPVVFIKAAYDSMSLWEDFRPPSAVAKRGGNVGNRYEAMMESFARTLQHWDILPPELAGRKYEISGFVWFQGEADAISGGKVAWEEYEANLKDLIHDVRTSFGVPEMPAVIIQINDLKDGVEPEKPNADGSYGGWHYVREAQRKVAEDDPHVDWVLTLDQSRNLHYDTASYLTIGTRCGEKMLGLLAKEARNDRDSAGVKAVIQTHFLDKIKPPMTEKPDMKALCKDLYGYFPFDEFGREETDTNRGKRQTEFLSGAAVQPVKGTLDRDRTPQKDVLVDGVCGKALQLRGKGLIHFYDFKEPVDKKGMIGDMAVSFWIKSSSTKKRCFRLGRGVGYRLPPDNVNWQLSWEANYAGWDITRVGSHSEVSFTTRFEDVGPMGLRTWGATANGVEWVHVVLMYKRQAGEKSIWINGQKCGLPREGHGPNPLDHSDFKGLGIVSAVNAPLSIEVDFDDDFDFACFDELCLWSRVLTEEEIGFLYNNGHGLALPKE